MPGICTIYAGCNGHYVSFRAALNVTNNVAYWHEPEEFGGAAIPSALGGATDAPGRSLARRARPWSALKWALNHRELCGERCAVGHGHPLSLAIVEWCTA
jgi:hypothetical protein